MAKPVTGLITFGASSGPDNTGDLDTNYSVLAAAINDLGTYGNFLQDTSGVANSLVCATAANITASLAPGLRVEVKVANTNTGATTLAINLLAAKPVVNQNGAALTAGQLVAGGLYQFEYDGANFQLIGPNATNYGLQFPANTGMGNGAPFLSGAQAGTAIAPVSTAGPMLSFTEYISATLGGGNGYTGGALWASSYLEGGTLGTKGVTGFVQIDANPNGQVLLSADGLHGFAVISQGVVSAGAWSAWMTTHDNNTGIAVTGASGTGATATLTFAVQPVAIPVGTLIQVTGMNPAAYNTAFATVTASTTGSVSYASAANGAFVAGGLVLSTQPFGAEIDLVLSAGRTRVTNNIGSAPAVGLWINNQSDEVGNFHATAAIGITGESNALGHGFTSQWYTGILFVQNSIVPGAANEAIQINGAALAANRYCGTRLIGNFDIGIDLSGGTYTGTAAQILLANGFAVWALKNGGGDANLFYLNGANTLIMGTDATTTFVKAVGVNGVAPPVQVAGWGAPTGAAVQNNFAGGTATLAATSAAVAQLITDLKNFGLYAA